jgi:hypothetical protein
MDIPGMLKQLREERDLLDRVIEEMTSLADARKRGPGRPRVIPRRGDVRGGGGESVARNAEKASGE